MTCSQALYAFGRRDAIGISLMGVERSAFPDNDLIACYDLITQLAPPDLPNIRAKARCRPWCWGPTTRRQEIKLGDYTLKAAYQKPRVAVVATPSQQPPPSAAIFIATGPDEFYLAGSGVSVTFCRRYAGT